MSSREDLTIAEIHDVLCNFVITNPDAWAPIISTWALELLGKCNYVFVITKETFLTYFFVKFVKTTFIK